MKKVLVAMCLVAMFLFGCSSEKVPSNEGEERKAKRFEELKGLPLDTVLTRAYKFYEQFQATGDTLLRDSMDDYRNHFFARWELTSDSLCGTVAPDDSLAAELREIYNVVLEFYTKRKYSYVRDRAKRDSLQAALYEMMQKPKHINIIDDILADMERRKKNPDSVRAVQNQRDSAASAKIWGIPLEEAISGLQEDSSSLHNVDYFVQTMEVLYTDTSASDMNELDKINRHRIKRNTWKETRSACLGRTSMGQKVLILNKEYESLLNNFMRANVHESRSERYTILPVKYPFWHPMISVVPHHSGDDFHFESFPAMGGALFN
ncbi:MAG: hypothetical protein J6T54_01755, partial [Fibrobacter sp.]|nr:hypothetical protein [Fibrobacter sp.]